MLASIMLRIRLGPLVSFEIEGDTCKEISDALDGYEDLNQRLDLMCTDLAGRVYPDGTVAEAAAGEVAADAPKEAGAAAAQKGKK